MSSIVRPRAFLVALLAVALACVRPASATWSIILVDTRTGEIAIGSATCLTGFDLERYLPVVRVRVGAGVAQSAVDTNSGNRRRIWNGLIAGSSPEEILALLAQNDPSHQIRQYGIVDVRGRGLTFTGTACGAWAGGVTGTVGTLVYAIQGNVLTCDTVISAAEAAVRDTSGDLAERVMAGMEAARAVGGDGRCSCMPSNPTACGCPPAIFTKSAHVGFLIVARRGDVDGVCNASQGCASGTYFLDLNIANQQNADTDPVIQLRNQLTQFRSQQAAQPDAIESIVSLSRGAMLANGTQTAMLTIDLRDWRGDPVSGPVSISIQHDGDGSAASCAIGAIEPLGGSLYQARLTAGNATGIDRFLITAVTDSRTTPLMPSPTLRMQDPRADLNADGEIDFADLALLLSQFGIAGPSGDFDRDGDVDLVDLAGWLAVYGRGY